MKGTLTKVTEWGKNLLIFLLTVLLLLLLLLLMISQRQTDGETLPLDHHMVVYEAGAETHLPRGLETDRLLPAVFVWKTDETLPKDQPPLRYTDASSSVKKGYQVLYPLLRDLFGADAKAETLAREEGDALWASCRKEERFIYLRYPGELPASVIRMYTYSETADEDELSHLDDMPTGTLSYVKELFLLSDGGNALRAVTRDASGSVCVFRRNGGEAGHIEDVRAYIEIAESYISDAGEAYFAGDCPDAAFPADGGTPAVLREASGEVSRSDTVLIPAGILSYPVLSFRRFSADALFSAEHGEALAALLSAGGIRAGETENYYTDHDGARSYLSAESKLTVSPGGNVGYDALQNGGLPVSSYLGYSSVTDSYELSEYLQAADRMLSFFTEYGDALFGEKDAAFAEIRLSGVSLLSAGASGNAAAGGVRVTYSYYGAGLPLVGGDGAPIPAFTVDFSGGNAVSFRLYVLSAEETEGRSYVLSQSVALRAMAYELRGGAWDGGTKEGVLKLGYVLTDAAETAAAEWLFEETAAGGGVGT